jgi:hypothetical protein
MVASFSFYSKCDYFLSVGLKNLTSDYLWYSIAFSTNFRKSDSAVFGSLYTESFMKSLSLLELFSLKN